MGRGRPAHPEGKAERRDIRLIGFAGFLSRFCVDKPGCFRHLPASEPGFRRGGRAVNGSRL